jgi:hypothetical protein
VPHQVRRQVAQGQRAAAALAEAGRGRPSAVVVAGEAGVGKTRLVREFADRSRGAGARVLIGGCLELGADGLPFAPFTAVLRELVRDLGAARVAELLPGGATRELARLLPEFGEPAGPDEAGEARARLFEQLLTLLERLAETGPVVSVIEDMHWADQSSRDLLAFLIRNQPSAEGLLIVVTYRSDDLHRAHPLRPLLAELDRIGWVTRMDLVVHDALNRFDLQRIPHFGWPLLVAGARACAAAATAHDGAVLAKAAAMLDRLRIEAGNLAAEGLAQQAQQLTFAAEAARAGRALAAAEAGELPQPGGMRAAWDRAVQAWEAVGEPYPLAVALLRSAQAGRLP